MIQNESYFSRRLKPPAGKHNLDSCFMFSPKLSDAGLPCGTADSPWTWSHHIIHIKHGWWVDRPRLRSLEVCNGW